jgi:hypothetical protein
LKSKSFRNNKLDSSKLKIQSAINKTMLEKTFFRKLIPRPLYQAVSRFTRTTPLADVIYRFLPEK